MVVFGITRHSGNNRAETGHLVHNGSVAHNDAAQIASGCPRKLNIRQVRHEERRNFLLPLRMIATKFVGFPPLDTPGPTELLDGDFSLEVLEVHLRRQRKVCLCGGEDQIQHLVIVHAVDGDGDHARNQTAHEGDSEVDDLLVPVDQSDPVSTVEVALVPDHLGDFFGATGKLLPRDGCNLFPLLIEHPVRRLLGMGPGTMTKHGRQVIEPRHGSVPVVRIGHGERNIARLQRKKTVTGREESVLGRREKRRSHGGRGRERVRLRIPMVETTAVAVSKVLALLAGKIGKVALLGIEHR